MIRSVSDDDGLSSQTDIMFAIIFIAFTEYRRLPREQTSMVAWPDSGTELLRFAHHKCKSLTKRSLRLSSVLCPASDLEN